MATHLKSCTLDLKHEALESLSIGVGGTRAAAIWDVITGAFALQSELVIHPFSDYSSKIPDEDPFDTMDPAATIGHPLGYDVAAAAGYKPVDHIEAALHHMQIGVPLVTPPDALGPLLIPDDPSNPASHAQVKATAAQQRCAASGLPACVSLFEATLAYPISKEKTSATGIPQKYLSKQLTALSPRTPCTHVPSRAVIISLNSWPVFIIIFAVCTWGSLSGVTTVRVTGGPRRAGWITMPGSIHCLTLTPQAPI